tara:strand:+ start:43 stop:267 length:225 start_codon:yes stop_codon:yes gene_type:complete
MTFQELDLLIRDAVEDTAKRRKILEGLHGIEEGMNFCANFYLNVTGHTVNLDGTITKKDKTKFQINENLLSVTK